jgi:hypothetical protein
MTTVHARVQKCSFCGVPGHTILVCNDPRIENTISTLNRNVEEIGLLLLYGPSNISKKIIPPGNFSRRLWPS